MFTKSYRLFSILGFKIGIDLSWFFLAALIIWSLGTGFFPGVLPGREPLVYYIIAAIAALGMFGSIIFHELAHAIVARYYKIQIAGITLFIFGGVAELEDEPPTAKSEFLVAIAGPISSYLLAGILLGLAFLLPIGSWQEADALIYYLMIINIVLATFNLIPAFPLDGGRMLRAAIWGATGSLRRATRISSFLGAGLGGLLIAFGVYNSFMGATIGGLWQILIGFFIINAAGGARRQMEVLETLRGVRVGMLMKSPPPGVPGNLPVSEITDHPQLSGSRSFLPVVEDGRLVGLVQPEALDKIPERERPSTQVRQVASELREEETLSPDDGVLRALNRMRRARGNQAFVLSNGQITGWIEARDIFNYLDAHMPQEKAAQEPA